MSTTDTELAERPAHVPPELVVDLDYHYPPGYETDVHLAWKRLHDGPDVFWTPRHGGHWVAVRGDDIEEIQRNWEVFSHKQFQVPKRTGRRSLPLEADPPEHTGYRALISPLFTPDVLKSVGERARELVRELIDNIYDKGRCEFIEDFSRQLPIRLFLDLVDLPLEDRAFLLPLAEKRVRSKKLEDRERAKEELLEYLNQFIKARQENPGTDFMSRVVTGKINGERISDEDAEDLMATLMFGGLDTVASMMGFLMKHLAQHPKDRKELLDNPGLIPSAVNEMIRRHGLSSNARLIMRDVELSGVKLPKGDVIFISNMLCGLDERRFPDPLKVDFHRPNASQHAAFGHGPHRCPGSNLARMELKILLEEWLPRIPEFSLDANDPPVQLTGRVTGMGRLPLIWPT